LETWRIDWPIGGGGFENKLTFSERGNCGIPKMFVTAPAPAPTVTATNLHCR
jgi:hypothetical protein